MSISTSQATLTSAPRSPEERFRQGRLGGSAPREDRARRRRNCSWSYVVLSFSASGDWIRWDPSVQVKRVSGLVSARRRQGGGRVRTKRVGTSALMPTANRVWPMPSDRQRSDRPTTMGVAGRFEDTLLHPEGREPARWRFRQSAAPEARRAQEVGWRRGDREQDRPRSPTQPERRPERLDEPGRYFDRGPLVLGASEGRDDDSGSQLPGARQHTYVAGRPFEDSPRGSRSGSPLSRSLRWSVEEDELDFVLRGESHDVRSEGRPSCRSLCERRRLVCASPSRCPERAPALAATSSPGSRAEPGPG